MIQPEPKFRIGQHVRCFDSSRYVDDISTPLSMTVRPATIERARFSQEYGWLYDVRFSDRGSTAHFEMYLEHENEAPND